MTPYFGISKPGVVTDRLGSVRARQEGGVWTNLSYYPWGQEKTPYTPDGKEKFGTYLRDSTASGQDYAQQRYYSPNMGRFFSPDPYIGSVGPGDPGSWNRYIYTRGDPINRVDPSGMEDSMVAPDPPPDVPIFWPAYYSSFGFGDKGTHSRMEQMLAMDWGGNGGDGPVLDAATNQHARGLLRTRLQGFKSSNCWKILSHEGVNVQNILDNYSKENFFDVRQKSAYGGLTQSQIGILSSDTATLSTLLGGADARVVGKLGSASTTAVLVGKQHFFAGNTDTLRMNSLLHEMLHALGGFTDSQILNNLNFLQNGLVNKSVGNILDTSGISDWLARDCMKEGSSVGRSRN